MIIKKKILKALMDKRGNSTLIKVVSDGYKLKKKNQ